MHCRKEINATCLFKESFPAIYSFWEFQASLPARSVRFLRAAACSTGSALWFHHAHPFVALVAKNSFMQRSRGFGHGVVAYKICCGQYSDCMWLCSQLCYVTAANQWTIVEIEILATVSWTCGCQPFSCRCSQNVMHCRNKICSTCLLKESIPTIPCGNSKHPSLSEA